jgi:hypothetical protein
MTMIERVARALMDVRARYPAQDPKDSREFPVLDTDPDFDDLPADSTEGTEDDPITKEAVLRLARAAITAMREPTDAMKIAGYETGAVEFNPMFAADEAETIYRAMLTAALVETPDAS